MTVCFPPLIKPDRRFSRIRLSEFLCRHAQSLDCAFRYRVICTCRTFSGAVSPAVAGPSPHPSLRFSPAEQVTSLRSPAGCPNQRSGTESSLLPTPPTSALAQSTSLFTEVVPSVESSLLAMTDLPAYTCVTSQHVAYADPAGPLLDLRRLITIELCGLRPILRGSAAGSNFRGSSL